MRAAHQDRGGGGRKAAAVGWRRWGSELVRTGMRGWATRTLSGRRQGAWLRLCGRRPDADDAAADGGGGGCAGVDQPSRTARRAIVQGCLAGVAGDLRCVGAGRRGGVAGGLGVRRVPGLAGAAGFRGRGGVLARSVGGRFAYYGIYRGSVAEGRGCRRERGPRAGGIFAPGDGRYSRFCTAAQSDGEHAGPGGMGIAAEPLWRRERCGVRDYSGWPQDGSTGSGGDGGTVDQYAALPDDGESGCARAAVAAGGASTNGGDAGTRAYSAEQATRVGSVAGRRAAVRYVAGV